MRRLLRDVAENRPLGDTTTLADPAVVTEIAARGRADRRRSERRAARAPPCSSRSSRRFLPQQAAGTSCSTCALGSAAAERGFSDTPDGWQARYDAARTCRRPRGAWPASPRAAAVCAGAAPLRGRARHLAESFDRPVRRGPPASPWRRARAARLRVQRRAVGPAPAGGRAAVELAARLAAGRDRRPAQRPALERAGRAFRGWAGFWVHDLRTGRTPGGTPTRGSPPPRP